jgi:hypothetical protein
MNEQDLKGMTVNERLCVLELMDKFDSAIKSRDSKASVSVLTEANLSIEQALETVTAILENPKKYGY